MFHRFSRAHALAASLSLTLAACGFESTPTTQVDAPANVSVSTETFDITSADTTTASALDSLLATPQFHVAPVDLAEPAAEDSADPSGSAKAEPHRQKVTAALSMLSTRGLTKDAIDDALMNGVVSAKVSANAPSATPLAAGTVVATYTPAQIRAAYGLPALPAVGTTLSASQAAQFGAGQTIYIVDAFHNPNAVAELASFNQRFALPTCTTVNVSPTATLPLAAAPTSGCTISVVYATSAGSMTANAPAYDQGWATEIALDVQWAHAIAPLARIVLIEAADASVNALLGAVTLAGRMGPGAVSMSFGTNEGNWTSSVDATFTTARMSYFAAAGDSGTAVEWPAVSSRVVAVGGTTLTWSGTGARSESAWSGTGGGKSSYVAAPSYQIANIYGLGTPTNRNVSDVAFNADPSTGQYVAVISPGATTASWISAGGTSISAPQWAALTAIANALRAQSGQAPLGAPHAQLYAIAANTSAWTRNFNDVASGANGGCAQCYATTGYDQPTGLGTPNAAALLATLNGSATPVTPVVQGASISGTAGTPLSFTVSVSAPNAVTFTLSGAPSGMTISSTGTVSWSAPVAGNYSVTVNAKDSVTGLVGAGVVSVKISAPLPPSVANATINGTSGVAINYALTVTSPDPVTFALTGAPSGMTVTSAGVLAWSNPVTGSYAVTVTAKDTRTNLTGSGRVSLTIAAPKAPTVNAISVSGVAGRSLSFAVTTVATNPLTFTLAGAPSGMTISSTGTITWPSPVAGKYVVTVTAKDTKTGLSGSGSATVTIAPPGPVITASGFTGVVGKTLTGTIAITDATSNTLSISISGIPSGMSFAISGTTFNANWASPVAGSYRLSVNVKDGNGLSASLVVPVTVAAK